MIVVLFIANQGYFPNFQSIWMNNDKFWFFSVYNKHRQQSLYILKPINYFTFFCKYIQNNIGRTY